MHQSIKMVCNKCGKEKKEIARKYKKGYLCKECKSKINKEYRKNNKEKLSEYFKKIWKEKPERREKNLLYKELQRTGINATKHVINKTCEMCSMNNEEHKKKYNERLHIHHLDNNGRHNIRKGIKPIHKKLMVLCRSCHVTKDNLENKKYSNNHA